MEGYMEHFEGKRITVLGLGLLGRGVGDAAFLAECGARVTVTDKKTEAELAESVQKLERYPNVTFHLGGHVLSDFTDTDMVIKAAGVRLDSPEIQAARDAGVEVAMSTALFAKFAMEARAAIVGITGTRGKSTTTQMIYQGLKHAGKSVFLGGNVRGVSTLALLPHIKAGGIAVLELDSWQLQGFGDLQISPNVSVFTNLMPDHQNYYAGMDDYFADKAKIFLNQKPDDVIIAGPSIADRIREARPFGKLVVPEPLPDDWLLQVAGEHNRLNAALAREALRALGIDDGDIRTSLESFQAVEGRLQLVGEINGAKVYNDNNATTPDATIAALKALDPDSKKNIILLMGGADKSLDMNALLYEAAKRCERVILLAGSGTDRIVPLMGDYSIYGDLESAVKEAVASAKDGSVILFSPAFASFGLFKNEYDRNDQFMDIVKELS